MRVRVAVNDRMQRNDWAEEEGRLSDPPLLEDFIERVFAYRADLTRLR